MRFAIKIAGVVALTAVLAWLGLFTGRGTGHVPAVWWADAAVVSLMLVEEDVEPVHGRPSSWFRLDGIRSLFSGSRLDWPALLLAGYAGNCLARLAVRDPWPEAMALPACDLLESAIAAYGVALTVGSKVDRASQRQLIQFVTFAVVLGPVVASAAAAVTLHLLAGADLNLALRWFPPQALGMSVVPPLVLGLSRSEILDLFRPGQLLRTLLYLSAVSLGTVAVFSGSDLALLLLIIPPLLMIVLRLGLSGGALGCCLVAAIGTDETIARNRGPLSQIDPSLEHRILVLQLFLATAVLSVSVVGVVVAELRRANHEVHDSELRYRSLAATMQMLASIDPLTRLANRRRFDEVLEQEWQRALRTRSPLSLIFFDADFFKAYNDHYGHPGGDECLRRIAEKMSEMARRPADLVARYGGEEFGVVLPETCAEGARSWAERLRANVQHLAFAHPGSDCGVVTVSGGCATMIPVSGSADEFLRAADAALYEAKRKGRNRIEAAFVEQLVEHAE